MDRRAFLRSLLSSAAAVAAAPLVGDGAALRIVPGGFSRLTGYEAFARAAIEGRAFVIHGLDAHGEPISEIIDVGYSATQKAFRTVSSISLAFSGSPDKHAALAGWTEISAVRGSAT